MESSKFNEVVSYDEFELWDDKSKIEAIRHWQSKFTNKEIAEAMGISESSYYKRRRVLLNEDDGGEQSGSMRFTPHSAIDLIIPRNDFNKLPPESKYALLEAYMSIGLKLKDIAAKWGSDYGVLKSMKHMWKQHYIGELESREKMIPNKHGDNFLFEIEQDDYMTPQKEHNIDNDKLLRSFEGDIKGEYLADRVLSNLSGLRESEIYKVSLKVFKIS